MMMVTISKDFEFEAAHAILAFPEEHKCRKLHGHSFKVTISVTGAVDIATGLLFDHAKISDAMKPIIEELDHAHLNEIKGLEHATFENLCIWIWQRLKPLMPELSEVVVWETADTRCSFRG